MSGRQGYQPPPAVEIDRLLGELAFDGRGLIPAIAQAAGSGEVLMLAWMNAASLRETLESGRVCYWSRSRQALWRKGETSGNFQSLVELRWDCDADCLLLLVEQQGPACHTGRRSCFYRAMTGEGAEERPLPQTAATAGES